MLKVYYSGIILVIHIQHLNIYYNYHPLYLLHIFRNSKNFIHIITSYIKKQTPQETCSHESFLSFCRTFMKAFYFFHLLENIGFINIIHHWLHQRFLCYTKYKNDFLTDSYCIYVMR